VIRHGVVALVALVALSACGKGEETRGQPSPADRHPSVSAQPCLPPPSGVPSPGSGPRAPDLALACFAGGGEVRLDALGRPAVVNLWASWCEPCYTELPALDAFAEKHRDLLVLGAATKDPSRDRVQGAIDNLGLSFPMLYDPDGKLLTALGKQNLPLTLFVTAAGTLAYVYNAAALDAAGFERLARQYLGVT
jgi:thiol-disulfide isomerase/thioredoxin